MALFTVALVAIGVAVAWIRARTVVRRRPKSPEGVVLRAIDDQILWAAIATGAVAIASWWVARGTIPWLAWSWMRSAAEAISEGALSSGSDVLVVVLGVVELAAYACIPVVLLVDGAPVALMAALWNAGGRVVREQVLGDWRPRWAWSVAIRPALFMLLGVPVIAAMECALMTIAVDAVLTRRLRQRVAAEGQPVVGGPAVPRTKMDQSCKTGNAMSPLWDRLPHTEQDRCAQMAGFAVVLAAVIQFGIVLVG